MVEGDCAADGNGIYASELRKVDEAKGKFLAEGFPERAVSYLSDGMPVTQLDLPAACERFQAPYLPTEAGEWIAVEHLVAYLNRRGERC